MFRVWIECTVTEEMKDDNTAYDACDRFWLLDCLTKLQAGLPHAAVFRATRSSDACDYFDSRDT